MKLIAGQYYLINKCLFYIHGIKKGIISSSKIWRIGDKFNQHKLKSALRVPKSMIDKLFFVD